MNKVHYTYMACDELDANGNFSFPVEVSFDLLSPSEVEAEKYVRILVKRQIYSLRKMSCCPNS